MASVAGLVIDKHKGFMGAGGSHDSSPHPSEHDGRVMTPTSLSASLTARGLTDINAALVAAWMPEDRQAAIDWLSGGPVPDWLYGFDSRGVLGERKQEGKPEPRQKRLFE
jgi:hypothetical protein